MFALHWILVVLHIITAAAWFGLGLRLGVQARVVAGGGAAALAKDAGRSVRFMNIFIVLTLVFALGALLTASGTVLRQWQYHVSLLLILVLNGIQFLAIRPGWKNLTGDGDPESARKRVAIGTGIGHFTWLVILVLMFWTEFSTLF